MTDADQSDPLFYAVLAQWPLVHLLRLADQVALCGRPMPDRLISLRSSTIPAGTDPCPECQSVCHGWPTLNP